MVEGPGCTLHGERLRARVRRGQAVRSARGSALAAGACASPVLGCANDSVASRLRTDSYLCSAHARLQLDYNAQFSTPQEKGSNMLE
uniref:Uncharacterized protein n=1 Tax=Strigops habroptila TaxID=2489341 RepID=A0A672UMU0_STRHB